MKKNIFVAKKGLRQRMGRHKSKESAEKNTKRQADNGREKFPLLFRAGKTLLFEIGDIGQSFRCSKKGREAHRKKNAFSASLSIGKDFPDYEKKDSR